MMRRAGIPETVLRVSVAFDGRDEHPAVGSASQGPTTQSSAQAEPGWPALFWEAFKRSSNPMLLLDDQRCHVEVNGAYLALLGYPRSALIGRPVYEFIEAGPLLTRSQWAALLRQKQFTGVVGLVRQDGLTVRVEFGGHPEIVTGHQLVLVVALKTVRGMRRIYPERQSSEVSSALSKRELEIVEMVAMGLTSSEIASELHVSHNTVRTHVRNAMTKLEARSRAHLVAKSLAEAHYWRDLE
jgi:DNA-binding CsgD family transcriptional regulator